MTISRDGEGRTPVTRRSLGVVLAGALAAAGLGVVLTTAAGSLHLTSACGPGGQPMRMADGSHPCVHADQPPPGVDLDQPVSTAALRARPGAGPAVAKAAEDAGLPTAVASTATSPEVPCDGDGTSGYRVQAMYVVEQGATNRYASLKSTLQNWAAGVDDVFNRSAALTGGVRHVRYVTTPGATAGTCVADVVNVTVPSGALANFNTAIQAVQNLGYTDPSRKYLMWADTSGKGICGIATLYNDDNPTQANLNNGSYAQYARIDSPCWGGGNGTWDHSVEAHELTHNLGGVQNTAAHSTHAGHCWDESDTMCYADGGNHAMVQVCPSDEEYLLDCNSDDYYSTYPDPGSYLDTHWDAASSRFLIGGGANGTVGAPTVLGARIAVNNPAVPGLSTQASVTPSLPAGRTLTSVTWKAGRADCSVATPSTPTDLQAQVTCPATATAPTTITATLTDSTGATKTVTSPLTFATGTARPLAAELVVAGQSSADAGSASVCTSAPTPVRAVLTDAATGQPVKGLTATFTKQATGQATAAAAGGGVTAADGAATVTQTAAVPTTFGVKATATKVYAALAPVTLATTVGRCSPVLTASASADDVYNGDPVTISGTLTRDVGGDSIGVAGASLPVTLVSQTTVSGRTVTRTTTLGSARTGADGSWSLVTKPAVSGELHVSLAGSASYAATAVDVEALTVRTPSSDLSAQVDRTDVGYGTALTVTGRLQRVAGGSTTAAGAQTVSAKLTAPGKAAVVVGTGRTAADGTFTLQAPVRASGELTVVYAGSTVLPGSSADLGAVTVGTWGTTVTATQSATTVAAGQPVTVTAHVTRSYGGASENAKGVPVRLVYRAPGATRDTTMVGTTTAAGSYAFRVSPRATTTYQVQVAGVVGYTDGSAGSLTVTVP